ncbi:hypothetical protein RY27_06210, partial [Litorilinea aerophila]
SLGHGEKLRVVASDQSSADVVRQVGGKYIELATHRPAGADPHSYTATPADLRTLNQAHVIFINGLGLEEAMAPVLENLEGDAVLVPVNVGVTPRSLAEEAGQGDAGTGEEHGHEHDHEHGQGVDPHTWFDVRNVMIWVQNIQETLSRLDPAHAPAYQEAAERYRQELEALDREIRTAVESIPPEKRLLVTDHETLGYLAAAYGFKLVGAVLPSFSTMAAPSARELAALQEQIRSVGATAIFVGTNVNPALAEQVARDLNIAVVPIYTEELSAPDGPAPTYVAMMRYNIQAIVEALR